MEKDGSFHVKRRQQIEFDGSTRKPLLPALTQTFGGVSFLLGIVVLVGWYTQNTALIQVHDSFAPMQYNTALGFLLSGIGLISLLADRSKLALICGAVVMTIGILTLIEYVFSVNLGIDQLFMEHYVMTKTSHPGRMAPNTALCFSLTGIAILLISFPQSSPRVKDNAGIILGFMILIFALFALYGYATEVEQAYGWGELTRMAIHTCLGFMCLGIGLVSKSFINTDYTSRQKEHNELIDQRWMVITIMVVLAFFALNFWMRSQEEHAHHSSRHTLEIQAKIKHLLLLLTDVETGQRGFLLTGNDEYLESYHAALKDIQPTISQLSTLTRDNPTQQEHVRKVSALIQDKLEELAQTITLMQQKGSNAAFEVVQSNFGQHMMDEIRQEIARMYDVEASLLKKRDQRLANVKTFGFLREGWIVLLFVIVLMYARKSRNLAQQFQRSESQLQAIVDHAMDGIIVIDDTGHVESFSKACEQIFGYEANEVLGQNIKYLMPEPYCSEHDRYLNQYRETGEKKIIGKSRVVEGKRKDGSTFPLELSANEMAVQSKRLFTGIVRDISERKNAEKEREKLLSQLAETNELNQAILDSSTHLIISTDLNGTVTQFNTASELALGYKAKDIVGKQTPALWHDEVEIVKRAKELSEELGEKIEPGFDVFVIKPRKFGPDSHEWTFIRKDGSCFPVELTVTSIRNTNSNEITGYLGIITDISQRKEAEEELRHVSRRLGLILENAGEGIFGLDMQGHTTFVNRGATDMLGYSPEEILNVSQHDLIHHHHRDGSLYIREECNIYAAFKDGKVHTTDQEVFWKKDGAPLPIEYTSRPIRDTNGEITGAVVVFRDITERKQTEEDLKATNEELEQFAYVASHDLKAPLRVIDNASKWLEEDLADQLTGENRENMNLIRGRVKRMEKLLDDLLEYSRIGRTTDARYQESVNGAVLVNEILELLAPPKEFTIEVSPTFSTIHVLKMPLQQILLNLVNNAIKHHNRPEGVIRLGVDEHDDQYAFTVSDNGPGIPPAFQEKVFEMFQTLKPRDQVEGSGMGLAMVQKHTDLAGGTIHLESHEGEGSTFTILWPKSSIREEQPV